jgi:hypothetical protein
VFSGLSLIYFEIICLNNSGGIILMPIHDSQLCHTEFHPNFLAEYDKSNKSNSVYYLFAASIAMRRSDTLKALQKLAQRLAIAYPGDNEWLAMPTLKVVVAS